MKMFSSESEYWVQSELTIKQHNIYQTAIPRMSQLLLQMPPDVQRWQQPDVRI